MVHARARFLTRPVPRLPVPAVNSSLPFALSTAPSRAWCLGGQTGCTRRERRLPPLGLGWAGRGGQGGQVAVGGGREAIESARHHVEVGGVHGERAGHHAGALGR